MSPRAAVIISNEKSHLNEIGFENAVAEGRAGLRPLPGEREEAGRKGSPLSRANFQLRPDPARPGGARRSRRTVRRRGPEQSARGPAPGDPASAAASEWTNVRTLGVTGDGKADDTAAIQKAIDGHRVLYFPSGQYLVKDTITLKPGYGADRLASANVAVRSSRQRSRLPGRWRAARRNPRAARRVQPDERPRRIHGRHQSTRGGRALVGGTGLFDGRRADARRARDRRGRTRTMPTTPPIPIRASGGTASIPASG